MRLSARTKAPSSRVSSNMVAAWVCSVLFMSCQDFRASGRKRLSTVSTMAWRGHERDEPTTATKEMEDYTRIFMITVIPDIQQHMQ